MAASFGQHPHQLTSHALVEADDRLRDLRNRRAADRLAAAAARRAGARTLRALARWLEPMNGGDDVDRPSTSIPSSIHAPEATL